MKKRKTYYKGIDKRKYKLVRGKNSDGSKNYLYVLKRKKSAKRKMKGWF